MLKIIKIGSMTKWLFENSFFLNMRLTVCCQAWQQTQTLVFCTTNGKKFIPNAHRQQQLQRMEKDWWLNKAWQIQGFADANETQKCYKAIKAVSRSTDCLLHPMNSKDGNTLIKYHEESCLDGLILLLLINNPKSLSYSLTLHLPFTKLRR